MINYEKEIETFRLETSRVVKAMFEETGSVDPVLFALVFKDNKFGIAILGGLEQFFISEKGKEAAAELMKKFNEETKALATAFASEGWMSIFEKGDYPIDNDGFYKNPEMRPSLDPQRKEVVNIAFETHDKKAFECWEVVRNEDDATLIDTTYSLGWEPKTDDTRGTFMDLLKENYDHISKLMKDISLN